MLKEISKMVSLFYNVESDEYKRLLYQIMYDIELEKCTDKIGWEHDIYKKYFQNIEERNSFIECPFEVEEGVLECNECNSKKTLSCPLQTRSADESTSVLVRCVECGNNWMIK